MRASNMKWFNRLLTGGIILLVLLLYISLPAAVPETPVGDAGLIRLHVLANSDSEADQALKRKVRDDIVQVMAPEFLGSKDIESARLTAGANLDRIESIARRVISAEGKDYPVTAELDTFPFPTKHYGGFILPAGDYEAVRVVIGNGGGANWWCVLFPPLCFVDMTRMVSLEAPAMSFPFNSVTRDSTAGQQPVSSLDKQPDAGLKDQPATCTANGQEPENSNKITAEDINEGDDCKVIFTFRLIELFSRL